MNPILTSRSILEKDARLKAKAKQIQAERDQLRRDFDENDAKLVTRIEKATNGVDSSEEEGDDEERGSANCIESAEYENFDHYELNPASHSQVSNEVEANSSANSSSHQIAEIRGSSASTSRNDIESNDRFSKSAEKTNEVRQQLDVELASITEPSDSSKTSEQLKAPITGIFTMLLVALNVLTYSQFRWSHHCWTLLGLQESVRDFQTTHELPEHWQRRYKSVF